MFPIALRRIFIKYGLRSQNATFLRYIRSIAHHRESPKLVKGKVKTVTEYDVTDRLASYKDLVKSVQKSGLDDQLETERSFLHEDYHGDVIENCDMYYDMHKSEERKMKSDIKKNIIGRKYFKLDRETNLLTHAAKQQIRFLHNSNPLEWNYKALSECFPISEAGVKKLLKCNVVLTFPDKIKAHDEDVAKKWQILKCGKISDEITPLTQKLYKEGKLVDDYFSGNPNLPTVTPPIKQIIMSKKEETVGEFSAIVQTYHDFEKRKMIGCKEDEKQVAVRDTNIIENSKKYDEMIKNIKKYKFASEEYDNYEDADPEVYPCRRKKVFDNGELPFSQFKEILREENEMKLKSKYKNEYDDFVKQQTTEKNEYSSQEKPQNCQSSHFVKISKYEKINVDAMYERNKKSRSTYKYDEKLGYQHPVGKMIKGKINISAKQYKKGKLLKVGQCIYDESGEFLCKVPT